MTRSLIFKFLPLGLYSLHVFLFSNSLMRGICNVLLPDDISFGYSTLLNLVLDPLFIFWIWKYWRIRSGRCCIASVITQGYRQAAVSFILFRGNQGIKIKLSSMKLEFFAGLKRMFEFGNSRLSLEQSSRRRLWTLMVMLVTSTEKWGVQLME